MNNNNLLPKNIFEFEYYNYCKLFFESQINHLKRNSYLNDTNYQESEDYAIYNQRLKDCIVKVKEVFNNKENKEINRKFYQDIDMLSRVEMIRFFKSSSSEFISIHNELLTLEKYIELLDVVVDTE